MQNAVANSSILRILVSLLCGLVLVACSMVESTLILPGEHGDVCDSDAGLYYLPKSVVEVKVVDDGGGRKLIEYIRHKVIADRRKGYCLDFLGSPTSHDRLIIQKERNLLQKITSDADDQSAEIAKNLIRAIFVGISGNPNFDPTLSDARAFRRGTLKEGPFVAQYDPFNPKQAALINDALREFGFCLILSGAGSDMSQRQVDRYCDDPLGRGSVTEAIAEAHHHASYGGNERHSAPSHVRGILYRSRLPYNYALFLKKNRKLRGGWELRGSETLYLENDSPIFAVGVDRTFFAARRTTLVFDKGELRDVTVNKSSELVGFVSIPLQIAQGIAALPANIIRVRININNNEAALARAEANLIEEYRKLDKALAQEEAASTSGGSVGGTSQSQTGSQPRAFTAGAFGRANVSSGAVGEFQTTVATEVQQTVIGTPLAFATCMGSCQINTGEVQCRNFCGCVVDKCSGVGDKKACEAYCAGAPAN